MDDEQVRVQDLTARAADRGHDLLVNAELEPQVRLVADQFAVIAGRDISRALDAKVAKWLAVPTGGNVSERRNSLSGRT